MGWFSKTLWLAVDDPDGSWFCNCRKGIVDAPWHNKETFPAGGNGWLWSCAGCARGFMFARCIKMRVTLDRLARKRTPRIQSYMTQTGDIVKNVLLETPEDWMKLVVPVANVIEEGERYVYFDGHVFPARNGPVKFDGLCRSHDLPDLPHLSESLTEDTLANPEYWSAS